MIYTNKEITKISKADIVSELPDKVTDHKNWDDLQDVEIPDHLKDNVVKKELRHREFNDAEFWHTIPYFKDIKVEEFIEPKFQNQNSVTKVDHLDDLLEDIVDSKFLDDVHRWHETNPNELTVIPIYF